MKQVDPSDKKERLPNDPFPRLTAAGDPPLRLVAWLIRNKDYHQLHLRTGIRKADAGKSADGKRPLYRLPVLVELETGKGKPKINQSLLDDYAVPEAYREERKSNPALRHVTATLPLTEALFDGREFTRHVDKLLGFGAKRVSLGVPGQPCLDSSLRDIGLPVDRKYKNKELTGEGVIVGIIDDGCALAHSHFLNPRQPGVPPESRIRFLWDQAATGSRPGWSVPADFYGLELDNAAIDAALIASLSGDGDVIREDEVYEYLDYRIGSAASHGTHVMDIAAGNGQSLTGAEGVACKADIIFVQLPTAAIEGGAAALVPHVVDGVAYVFAKAKGMMKSAVVNISYGGYDGPHDGTSELETCIDALLQKENRAVVIAAGNGFEANCHASKTVAPNQVESLRWIVLPEDPTPNDLEIWYDKNDALEIRLISPGAPITPAGWVTLGYSQSPIRRADNMIVGQIEHLPGGTGNDDRRIVINLRPTDSAAEDPFNAPAPSGTWTLEIRNVGGSKARFHAWIWRDDAGRPGGTRRRQSRFDSRDSRPDTTIAGWATGRRTISVGAFNSGTQEICRYSACGPTRRTSGDHGRKKPDVYAPAEEDARGRGVLSASSLGAAPTRMNGTSASAPHVTGLVALMFEYAKKHAPGAPKSLKAKKICKAIQSGAKKPLRFNLHQIVDDRVTIKQKKVKKNLIRWGKINFIKTMKKLLP